MSQDTREGDPQGIKRKREGPGSKRRASLACDTCQRQKEKCEGGPPCWRCQRLSRPCHFQEQPAPKKATFVVSRQPPPPVPTDSDQRVQNLEHIVRHFLGDVPLDEEYISWIVSKCSKNSEVESLLGVNESFDVQFVSRDVAFYSGEFSHWNFSEKLRRTTNCYKDTPAPGVKEYWRPTHLQSSIHIVTEVIGQLPPEPIAHAGRLLLVILAETLNSGKSKRLQDGLTRGMTLIRQMIGGTASQSEISYIESIEAAIRQLSSHDDSSRSTELTTNSSSSAYATFKNWTQSMKNKSSGNTLELSSFSPMSGFTSGGESVIQPDMSELAEFLNPDWPSTNLELDAEVFFGQVETSRGAVTTKKVVLATNAYTSALAAQFKDKIVPVRGTCCRIAVPPASTAPRLTNTLHSLTKLDDSRVLESAVRYFDGYMQRNFVGWEDSQAYTDRVWTGIMGYLSDGLPHVGHVPGEDGQFILAGFTGHGMPQIFLAAEGIAKMILRGAKFEETGLPRLFQSSQARLDKLQNKILDQNPQDTTQAKL
ncbi:uncharacterized protein N7477_008795 [Penicillium maclennaniae]|uniref:uncharacterized protein n=1 Tax=Penicillium maclennaniae TaxID=1343394 RepID=UPI002541F53C|nr:uncharacterized protein N7477_008795 [Penicillium maclennaniae]KAJ5666347.1 hypothetical protein N7477_008795 [Penicillium maclennaniae]